MGVIRNFLSIVDRVSSQTLNSLVGSNFISSRIDIAAPSFSVPEIPLDTITRRSIMSSSEHNRIFTGCRGDISKLYYSSNYIWKTLDASNNLLYESYSIIRKYASSIKKEISISRYVSTTIDSGFDEYQYIDFTSGRHVDIEQSDISIDSALGHLCLPIIEDIKYNSRISKAEVNSKRGMTSSLFYKLRAPLLAFDDSKKTYWAEYVIADDVIQVQPLPVGLSKDLIDDIMNTDNVDYRSGALCSLYADLGANNGCVNYISISPFCEHPLRVLGIYGVTSNKPYQWFSAKEFTEGYVLGIILDQEIDGTLYYKDGKYGSPIKVCDVSWYDSSPAVTNYTQICHTTDDLYFYYQTTSDTRRYCNISKILTTGGEISITDGICYVGDFDSNKIVIKTNTSYPEYIYDDTGVFFNENVDVSGIIIFISQEHYTKDIFNVSKNRFGYNNIFERIINNHLTAEYREVSEVYYNYREKKDDSYSFMESLRGSRDNNTDISYTTIEDMIAHSSGYTYKKYSYIYGAYDITIRGRIYETRGEIVTEEISLENSITVGLLVDQDIPVNQTGEPLGSIEWFIRFNGQEIPICPYTFEEIYEFADSKTDLTFDYDGEPTEYTIGSEKCYRYSPVEHSRYVFLNKTGASNRIYSEDVIETFLGTDINNSVTLKYTPFVDSSQITDCYEPNGDPLTEYVPIAITIEGPDIEYTIDNIPSKTGYITQSSTHGKNDSEVVLLNVTNYASDDIQFLVPFNDSIYHKIEYIVDGKRIVFSRGFDSRYKITVNYKRVANSFRVVGKLYSTDNKITPRVNDIGVMISNGIFYRTNGATLGACWGSIKSERLRDNIVTVNTKNAAGDALVKGYVWKWKKFTNCGNNTDAFYINVNSPNAVVYHDITKQAEIPLNALGEPSEKYLGERYNEYRKYTTESGEEIWSINGVTDSNPNDDIDRDIFNIGVLLKPGESCVLGMRFLLTNGDDTDIENYLCNPDYSPKGEESFAVDVVSAHPWDYKLAPSWSGELEMAKSNLPRYDDICVYDSIYRYDKVYYLRNVHEPSPHAQLCPF